MGTYEEQLASDVSKYKSQGAKLRVVAECGYGCPCSAPQ
jgi:hypothetical protein